MNRNPWLSIIVPTYNRAGVLPRAIRSVLRQSFKDYELIVVDDGSTDATPTAVAGFRDRRIRYLKLKKNLGFWPARNRGIQLARGKWISFLDSDDEYVKDGLTVLYQELSHLKPQIQAALFNLASKRPGRAQENLGFAGPNTRWLHYYPSLEEIVLKRGIRKDMHRCLKTGLAKANLFPEENFGFDTFYNARLAKQGIKFVYINRSVVWVHADCADQHSRTYPAKYPRLVAQSLERLLQEYAQVFRNHPRQLFDHQLRIARCYLQAKDSRFIWWGLKVCVTVAKKFISGAWRKV